jgi:hypothetical protein
MVDDVDIERGSISIGAKLALPGRQYENYNAQIFLEARFRPGETAHDRMERWTGMRRRARARLNEAMADAKYVALTANRPMMTEKRKTIIKKQVYGDTDEHPSVEKKEVKQEEDNPYVWGFTMSQDEEGEKNDKEE